MNPRVPTQNFFPEEQAMEDRHDPRRWFDIPAAAAYLCVSPRTIREAIWRGKLRRSKLGRKFILDRGDLDRWAEAEKRLEVVV